METSCSYARNRLQGATEDDESLIQAAKKDVEAFGKLYDKYYGKISRYIYLRTLDRALTEDLTSNTFYSAFCNIRRFKWKRIPFSAWLYRIATNEIRMHYRRNRRAKMISGQLESAGIFAASNPDVPAPWDTKMRTAEDYILVHRAIQTLKPVYEAVIVLRFFEDKTIKEVAQVLGKKEGTVKSLLHRGLTQLRAVLTKDSDSGN